MLRVYWTSDLGEAHIVESLLRAEGLHAWAFDTAFVRQDWFKTLAYGGYRVMVADADATEACRILGAYRKGELSLPDQEVDLPECPRCNDGRGIEDARPRRQVFALLIAFDVMLAVPFMLGTDPAFAATFLSVLLAAQLLLIWPGVVAFLIRNRYRCARCNERWRSPPQAFHEMASAVDGSHTPAPQPDIR